VVGAVENSGQGTGHTTWDGAVVLAKYLEHSRGESLRGKTVLETGAGE
jgi:protein N-lysine methyltransferase METTL21D